MHLDSGALALQLDVRDVIRMELASKLREILGNEIVADDPETLARTAAINGSQRISRKLSSLQNRQMT